MFKSMGIYICIKIITRKRKSHQLVHEELVKITRKRRRKTTTMTTTMRQNPTKRRESRVRLLKGRNNTFIIDYKMKS